MSRRGNCWDNVAAESFFSGLKKERIKKRIYKTREIARADLFDYIEIFYNQIRRHSHLDGMSLEAFDAALKVAVSCLGYWEQSKIMKRPIKRWLYASRILMVIQSA